MAEYFNLPMVFSVFFFAVFCILKILLKGLNKHQTTEFYDWINDNLVIGKLIKNVCLFFSIFCVFLSIFLIL